MAFTALPDSWIAVGKALAQQLFQRIKDNFDALNGTIETLDVALKNGSLEVDSDADGLPDNWIRSTYPAGAVARTTTAAEVAHGKAAIKMTHPGGVNNGGGYLESDYIICSEYFPEFLTLLFKATAEMKNIIRVYFYDEAKVALGPAGEGTEYITLYLSTVTPTQFFPGVFDFVPPAGSRFMKVRLVGGYTDTDVAGSTIFDGLEITRLPRDFSVAGIQADLHQRSVAENYWHNYGDGTFQDIAGSVSVDVPTNQACRIYFYCQVKSGDCNVGYPYMRYNNAALGATGSLSRVSGNGVYDSGWVYIDVPAGNAGEYTFNPQQMHADASDSGWAKADNFTPYVTIV